jgi:molybdate transport system substrate-binding protein
MWMRYLFGVPASAFLVVAIQNYTQFAPGVVTSSNQPDVAAALVTFLTSPTAKKVLKAKGFE